jgi:hypothetical protein
MLTFDNCRDLIVEDYEYIDYGSVLWVVCGCAWSMRTGFRWRCWGDELYRLSKPPWPHGDDVIFCSFNATAELSAKLALRHPLPRNILDLCVEHRYAVNGVIDKKKPRDLLAAMRTWGLSGIEAMEKTEMVDLILTGGPFNLKKQDRILDYCESDVEGTRKLLAEMREGRVINGVPVGPLNLERALFRGRYLIPATLAMRTGIPIDSELWQLLLDHREEILLEIVADCPVYKGIEFKQDRFAKWLADRYLLDAWPRTPIKRLATSDETFEEFSHIPDVEHLRQTRAVVSQLRTPSFNVIRGRNHYAILPYKAETSRNSTIGCFYQSSTTWRGLIVPPFGSGLIHADYSAQEFAIAAVLSGDQAMLRTYLEGDPYVVLGVLAGIIPPGGSKATHPVERNNAKTLMLALQYGMSERTLATKLNVSLNRAHDLLTTLQRLYSRAFAWFNEQVCAARWTGKIETAYGWKLHVDRKTNPRTIRNFKIQATGAEIMRLASLFLHESGIRVCCPIHDAFLVECRESDLVEVTAETKRQMVRAGQYLLGGFELHVEAESYRHPQRLIDPRGKCMWDHVMEITERVVSRSRKRRHDWPVDRPTDRPIDRLADYAREKIRKEEEKSTDKTDAERKLLTLASEAK